jgi:hypothetical protein
MLLSLAVTAMGGGYWSQRNSQLRVFRQALSLPPALTRPRLDIKAAEEAS